MSAGRLSLHAMAGAVAPSCVKCPPHVQTELKFLWEGADSMDSPLFLQRRGVRLLRRVSIRKRLTFLTIAFLILSVCFLFYLVAVSIDRDRAEMSNHNTHTLETMSNLLNNKIQTLYTVTKAPVIFTPDRSLVYEYLSVYDQGTLDRHPEVTDFSYQNACLIFAQEMFGLYSPEARRISIYKPDGFGYQFFSGQDRPPEIHGNSTTLRVFADPQEEWFSLLNEGLGRMELFPYSLLENESDFPLRDVSLYAGRAIVDSSNSHIIGYIVVRSDISELQSFLEKSLSFPFQRYGFFTMEGELLFGSLPEEQAAALLENAAFDSANELAQSSDLTLTLEDGSAAQYHYTTVGGEGIFILETPLLPLTVGTVVRHLPLFLLVGALLVLLTVFMRRLARSVTQPLARLQAACEGIRRGDYSPVTDTPGRDELATFTETFNTMAREIDDLIHEGYEKDLAATRLELQMLRLQINPHFLYNTLESIHSVAYLEGNREVGEMAVLLARILRYGVSAPGGPVTLRDEANNLADYIRLQELRYRGTVSFLVSIDPGVLTCACPRMILQPVVENALYHGVSSLERGGMVQVLGYREEDRLVLRVSDNGQGMEPERAALLNDYINGRNKAFQSIGLKNVNRRIRLSYGDEFGVQIQSVPGRGTMITVTLPAREPEQEGDASNGHTDTTHPCGG